jgi:hypothetical protein
MTCPPLQFLLLLFAGWVNRKQLDVIEYLKAESEVLREQLCGRRPRFTDYQRRRLAVRGKVVVADPLVRAQGAAEDGGHEASLYSWCSPPSTACDTTVAPSAGLVERAAMLKAPGRRCSMPWWGRALL